MRYDFCMRDKDFKIEYGELKRLSQGRDAIWNDFANEGPRQSNRTTGRLLGASSQDLQDRLELLIQSNELTEKQVRALGNIIYQTPGYEGAKDVNVGSFTVLEPYSGFAVNAKEAVGEFVGNLLGFGTFKVQGCKSGYMPVRLERPKTTERE